MVCLRWLSHALLILGYPQRARARSDEARASARHLAHPPTTAVALLCGCILHQLLREGGDGEAKADELIVLTREEDLLQRLSEGQVIRGWARAANGCAAQAIELIERGLAGYRATDAELYSPYFLALVRRRV